MKSDRIVAFVNEFEALRRLSNNSSFTILFSLIIKKGKKKEKGNPVTGIEKENEGKQ